MTAPTFTVAMPAFNAAATVRRSIESVLAQTRTDLELVVVDDGSTDETAAVVGRLLGDVRIRLLRQGNRGPSAARNAALAAARGRYVSFLDSDDLWLPTYLAAMATALEHAPEAGFAYTDAWTFDAVSGRVGTATAMQWQHPPATPPTSAEALLLELLERNFVYTSVTVPRAILERVGPFDTTLRAAVDYEMLLRIAAHGYAAVRPPGLLAVYRRHRPGSISSDRSTVLASLVRIYARLAADASVPAPARALAARRSARMQAELAAIRGAPGLDAAWRARLRPRLVGLRNTILRRDRPLAVTPRPLAEAFPELVAADRRVQGQRRR